MKNQNPTSLFSKYSAPIAWFAVMSATLMLLSVYDAETFLISFLLLAFSALGAVLSLPNKGALRMTKSPFVWLMLAFWALAFVSAVLSPISFTSFIFFCFLGMLPMGFIFVSLVPNKNHFFGMIFKLAAVLYAFLSFICLYQYFLVPELLPHGLTQYPFGNPNSLAGYLSLGLFCTYAALMKSKTQSGKMVCFGLAALIFTALLTTGSRGAFLSLLVGGSIFAFLLRVQLKQRLSLHVGFGVLAVVAFFALTILAPESNPQTPGLLLQKSVSGSVPLLWDRLHIWASTWEIIKDNFWTGTGVGTFFHVYPSYRDGDVSTAGHMAHNDVLQFWSEMGVLSPILFLALLGFAVLKTIQVFKKLDLDDSARILIVAPFCALGALVLHTQISFHFYALPTLFIIGTLLAFWFYNTEKILPSGGWIVSRGAPAENMIVKLCLSALIMCCTAMLCLSQMSEVLVDQAKVRARQGDMKGFAEGINLAGDLSFDRNARALALAATVPSGIVKLNGANMPQADILKNLLQAEQLLNRALANNPYMASSYHEKALVTKMAMQYVPRQYSAHHNGNPPTVRELMEKAFKYNPLHGNTRVELAKIMVAQGEREEAFGLLKEGLEWNYLGTKGMTLYQSTAEMAVVFGDTETRDEALRRTQRVYDQSRRVQERDAILTKKLGPVFEWIQ